MHFSQTRAFLVSLRTALGAGFSSYAWWANEQYDEMRAHAGVCATDARVGMFAHATQLLPSKPFKRRTYVLKDRDFAQLGWSTTLADHDDEFAVEQTDVFSRVWHFDKRTSFEWPYPDKDTHLPHGNGHEVLQ